MTSRARPETPNGRRPPRHIHYPQNPKSAHAQGGVFPNPAASDVRPEGTLRFYLWAPCLLLWMKDYVSHIMRNPLLPQYTSGRCSGGTPREHLVDRTNRGVVPHAPAHMLRPWHVVATSRGAHLPGLGLGGRLLVALSARRTCRGTTALASRGKPFFCCSWEKWSSTWGPSVIIGQQLTPR